MDLPQNLKYTKEHEWVKIDGDLLIVGITDHAQSELGDIIFIEFPDLSQMISKDDSFGTIEAVKTVADLFAPVSGKIIEINQDLEDNPELVNSDPYGEGWIVKITDFDKSQLDALLDSNNYEEII
ncbi:MAG: glycine cleavage system protein H [Candidatus Marinimicrobia bacterium]|nr:glycine cleavage system protein H [Candidatus Neomarinimicrobiota bacterium]|tara:strand:+ start:318 stop:692 length:375 start_codon:yes stop_codon:yes gene_type:complete